MAIGIKQSATYELHKALMNALATFQTTNNIKIYDHLPEEQVSYPYIVIKDFSEASWSDKTRYGATISVSIETYMQTYDSLSTKQLGNSIISTLDTNDIEIDNFKLIYHELSSFDINQMNNNVYSGYLGFTFFVVEDNEQSE